MLVKKYKREKKKGKIKGEREKIENKERKKERKVLMCGIFHSYHCCKYFPVPTFKLPNHQQDLTEWEAEKRFSQLALMG